MFGFGKKTDYADKFRSKINKKDLSGAVLVVREAFLKERQDEHLLAWLVGSIYELKIESAFDLLNEFTNVFPSSLHPIRAFIADLQARTGNFDIATNEARIYLRLAKESGLLEDLESKNIIRSGVSRAFLLSTAAYTELGARTHSKEILEMSFNYSLDPEWKETIESEIQQLNSELSSIENQNIDQLWRRFFENGTGASVLYEMCVEKEYTVMAKIVDLIESNFRFNKNYRVDSKSIFNIIVENNGSSALV